jgi:di/tricarboxylate transporter
MPSAVAIFAVAIVLLLGLLPAWDVAASGEFETAGLFSALLIFALALRAVDGHETDR